MLPDVPFLGGPPLEIDWDAEQEELYWLLYDELLAAARLGGQSALLATATAGVRIGGLVDWQMVNENAAAWAERYTYELVRQITDTNRKQLQTVISAFHRTQGMTRGELERLILEGPGGIPDLQIPGRYFTAAERAEMIAVTEVTRSYSAGEVEALQATNVKQVPPTQQPPAHVGCRCNISPFPRDDDTLSWQWQTLNDGLVCPICRPLHGVDVGAKHA